MTYRNRTVAVVVPAYNEESFVGDVIAAVPTFVDRVYPVDDCSTDDSWAVIEAAASEENRRRTATEPYDSVVEPLRHDENRGAGAAVITGYEAALAEDVDAVATMDGDGQMDPAFLPALLDPVVSREVAYAKGNRLADTAHIEEMSRWRLFGNALLTGLTRVASGYWRLRDPQNGYTVASAEVLEALDFDRLYERYGFRNDVLVHLNAGGVRVADVSHPAHYGDESSGIRYLSFVPNLSWLLLRRFWWRLGRQARRSGDLTPLTAFAGGTAGFLAGFAGRLRSVVSSGRSRRRKTSTNTNTNTAVPAGRRRRRTDGGVQSSGAGSASGSTSSVFVFALVLLCLGTLLDLRGRGGRVVRIDGEGRRRAAHDDGSRAD